MSYPDDFDPRPFLHFIQTFMAVLKKKDLVPNRSFVDDELIKIKYQLTALPIASSKNEVNFALLKFVFLMLDIQILSEAKWPTLNKAIEKINTSPKDQYYGERFEIGIASTLVRKKIEFSRPEIRPDFAINYKSSVLKIECTSKDFG